MDLVYIVLRLLHIFGGVFWAGATFMLVGFVEPTVRAAGPEGGRFMQRLAASSRFPMYISLAAILNVLSGLLLYWLVSAGLQLSWVTTGPGLSLALGGLAGILAAVAGSAISGRASARMAALAGEMQAVQGPPAPAQLAEMQALQESIRMGGVWGAILLTVSLIGMSIAQYL